jgi:hypothetical protein
LSLNKGDNLSQKGTATIAEKEESGKGFEKGRSRYLEIP